MLHSINARASFAMLSMMYAGVLAAHEDSTTVLSEQTEGSGLSFMQSGRSLMPASAEKAFRVGEFSADSADDFATMEDEFDCAMATSLTAKDERASLIKSKLPFVRVADHLCNPFLYVETFLVIGIFVFARRMACWVRKASSKKSSTSKAEAAAVANENTDENEKAPGLTFATLEKAIRAGDEALCEKLLGQGGRAAVRLEDACGCTALHVAAHCGSAAMERLLINYDADVNAREAWEETPLHIAARVGAVEACEVLLTHGSDIDAVNAEAQTPLFVAGKAQKEAACELILSHGGGVAGIDESALPPVLKTLLFRRVLCSGSRGCELQVRS